MYVEPAFLDTILTKHRRHSIDINSLGASIYTTDALACPVNLIASPFPPWCHPHAYGSNDVMLSCRRSHASQQRQRNMWYLIRVYQSSMPEDVHFFHVLFFSSHVQPLPFIVTNPWSHGTNQSLPRDTPCILTSRLDQHSLLHRGDSRHTFLILLCYSRPHVDSSTPKRRYFERKNHMQLRGFEPTFACEGRGRNRVGQSRNDAHASCEKKTRTELTVFPPSMPFSRTFGPSRCSVVPSNNKKA